MNLIYPRSKPLIAIATLLLIFSLFLNGCGRSSLLKKNPRLQQFVDQTGPWLPKGRGAIRFARFFHANRDGVIDLVVVREPSGRPPVVETWINRDEEQLEPLDRFWKGASGEKIHDIEIGDFNRDGTHEVALLGKFADDSKVKILTNNGRGYLFEDREKVLPIVKEEMDRFDVVDLDKDHNPDILLFNSRQATEPEASVSYPVQFLLNIGDAYFQDKTKLLWPLIDHGIAGGVYADYDNDRTLDVFLYYTSGKNAVLLNNGLGQLTDHSGSNLPPIKNQAVHSDWADFDQDGDQDLIVLTRKISKSGKEHSRELHYGLENNGQGYFTKRTMKVMPPFPVHRIYLLDGDGDEWPDMILVSTRGTYYLRGRGPWKFSIETKKRLPNGQPFKEMTFGDVNDDGYLDIFGVTPKGRGVLWVTEF
ncbi:MAG: VCBS repeat-containing protein [Candidatus Nitronauta litoralis]|uniref:VCBS repeat-containing protein n=1 Tax=Candidatus Nitronauta litoralis TaxID=2705533 RepID=A0A7T0FYS6_9BACT|nr:MAG: VCBS repeat-containing protein [Candidatus Nitronauta litoralis]